MVRGSAKKFQRQAEEEIHEGPGGRILRYRRWQASGELIQGMTATPGGGAPVVPPGFALCEYEQVHGSQVLALRAEAALPAGRLMGYDGVVTDRPGLLLTVRVADCIPIFLVEPVRRVIGLLHAGWRGTAGRVLERGIRLMIQEFGVQPERLELYLGPAVEGRCYPVSWEVWEWVARTVALEPPPLAPGQNPTLDLRAITRLQALGLRVQPEKIAISAYCTFCATDLFPSYRREGAEAGRAVAFLGLGPRSP